MVHPGFDVHETVGESRMAGVMAVVVIYSLVSSA